MKILFLDFDGVLTCRLTRFRMSKVHQERLGGLFYLVPDLKIVITSSWKHGHKTLESLLDEITSSSYFLCSSNPNLGSNPKYPITPYMFANETIGMTPSVGRYRGHEIDAWLQEHPEVENYVILDDDSDMLDHQMSHFVHTNGELGVTIEDIRAAAKILLVNENSKEDTEPSTELN